MKMNVSISEKFTLSIEEAAEYFGVGQKKLRKIVADNPDAEYVLHNGANVRIKRKKFEQFIDETSGI